MIRKVLLSLLCAATMGATQVHAQKLPVVGKLPKFHLGVKAGANFEQLSAGEQKLKPGVVFGAFAEVTKGKWGVEAEGLFNTAQYSFPSTDINGNVIGSYVDKAFYFNVPVLFEYKIIPRVFVQVGPQFGWLLSVKNSGQDVKSQFNTSNISGVAGLEVKLPLHLTVGARYILGFSDLNNGNVGDAWHTRTIQAYVGFKFI